nr:MAG TPA: hypothetical protein [Caudoviricetes sp.]
MVVQMVGIKKRVLQRDLYRSLCSLYYCSL